MKLRAPPTYKQRHSDSSNPSRYTHLYTVRGSTSKYVLSGAAARLNRLRCSLLFVIFHNRNHVRVPGNENLKMYLTATRRCSASHHSADSVAFPSCSNSTALSRQSLGSSSAKCLASTSFVTAMCLLSAAVVYCCATCFVQQSGVIN